MTELNSFGSVLTFAIALETQLRDMHQAAGRAALADLAEKNRQKLERVRRENVVEITLEPISGLNAAEYALATVADVEVVAARFYADVAPKINVKAAQRALEQIGKVHSAVR
ncbi:MAG: hypothetical protein IPK52_04830 [Chloroflexi bacterium]|nr:hypothetical protein [Chloroflexota bacterium]